MAKYKPYSSNQGVFAPVHLSHQIQPGTEVTEIRPVAYFHGRSEMGKNAFAEKMKRKIDSEVGRFIYCKRLGTVEPVFANICSSIGLKSFSLRGKIKVNTQWLMFCIVHNLKKIHQFGPGYA